MKARSHSMPAACPETRPSVHIVQVEVSCTHPLLLLKQALPWEAITEAMTRHWRRPAPVPQPAPPASRRLAWLAYGAMALMVLAIAHTPILCPGGLSAALSTFPQSVGRGGVAGFCTINSRLVGFVRDRRGRYIILDVPGATRTEALGISDNGSIVVGTYRMDDDVAHGFRWTDGQFETLDVPFEGVSATAATGSNNSGSIVGFFDDAEGARHGFLFEGGQFTQLDFPGSVLSAAVDVNDHGTVAGIYADDQVILQGFVYSDGHFTPVAVPFAAAIATDLSGMNGAGQLVGRWLELNPNFEEGAVVPFLSHGFVATPADAASQAARPRLARSQGVRWQDVVENCARDGAKWARHRR